MRRSAGVVLFVISAIAAPAQQVPDPNFDVSVASPALRGTNVLFDEAHHNFHTTDGRYRPFARLLGNDGGVVTPNKQRFTARTLSGFNVLVIANALGAASMGAPEPSKPAFASEECAAVREWVRTGGALLLIADHAPMGAAAEQLGREFGVDMSKGYTSDPVHHAKESNNQGFILFNRTNGFLADHAITRGRSAAERIARVQSFTGQSLLGPAGSDAFLRLADTAVDVDRPANRRASAAGRAQGVAFQFGQGRVVVMGEAGMLTAQLAGPDKKAMGMNQPSLDNKQLALNIVRWLAGVLN